MTTKARLLLVEDEASIREGVRDVLTYHGFVVDAVATGEEGLSRALNEDYDLIILDVMLPAMNGFEICRTVRQHSGDQAILMLTAKGAEDDIVSGFQHGADDYVTKPFSIRELLARVRALLRRSASPSRREEAFEIGRWSVQPRRLIASADGVSHELTPRELDLLALFRNEAGRIVSRRRLLKEVWNMARVDEVQTRTVDVHIAKLRKKLDPQGRLIRTIRGAGYLFDGES